MKISKIKIIFSVLLLSVTLISVSCNKMFDDAVSTRKQSESDAWKSIDDARSRLFGIYSLLRSALANDNNYWVWGELRNGDFLSTSRTDLKSIIDGDLNASYPSIESMKDWRPFYAVVNAANMFIERSPEILSVDQRYTELNNKVDIAQAKALRAWAYFLMVRIWGDVPLISNSHDGYFETKGRSSKEAVLNFCINDLLEAKEVLPFAYGIAANPILPGTYYGLNNDAIRNSLINRLSVYALLAHISAWNGNYGDVAIYTEFILNNKSLLQDFDYSRINHLVSSTGLFYGKDRKQLLALPFTYATGELGTSGMGHLESWTLAAPLISKVKPDIYVPRANINEMYENPLDQRFGIDTISKLYTTNFFSGYTSETPLFTKIKVLGNGALDGKLQVYSSAIVFSRLEDIALLRAEALAAIGNEAEAISLLNIIRKSRRASLYDLLSNENLIDAIFLERRRELIGEGHRWYDLVRYHKLKGTDPKFNELIARGGIYWPVSASILSSNDQIKQNPYWK